MRFNPLPFFVIFKIYYFNTDPVIYPIDLWQTSVSVPQPYLNNMVVDLDPAVLAGHAVLHHLHKTKNLSGNYVYQQSER